MTTIDPKDPDRLAIALESGDLQTRLDAIAEARRDAHVRLSARALAALIEALGDSRKVVQRRAVDALAAAAAHDPRVVAALQAALDSDQPARRWCAAYALGLIGGALDLRAQKALLEALANPDGDVRWAAANLIVRLGGDNPEPIRHGLIALEDHPDHNARKMAIYCLRDLKLDDPEVRATVERASRAAESGVRLAALSLLAHLPQAGHYDDAVEIALRCLESDPDLGVRRAAASALGRLGAGSARAAQALERAASQKADPGLARAARQALAGIAK
ncbi:MAG: HEAT repeat domain-containing protein [Candidatus Binatales bacterium]